MWLSGRNGCFSVRVKNARDKNLVKKYDYKSVNFIGYVYYISQHKDNEQTTHSFSFPLSGLLCSQLILLQVTQVHLHPQSKPANLNPEPIYSIPGFCDKFEKVKSKNTRISSVKSNTSRWFLWDDYCIWWMNKTNTI